MRTWISDPNAHGRPETRARRGQRTIVVLAVLALAVIGVAVGLGHRRLWLTWCRWEARKACLDPDFDEQHPGPRWRALLDATPESYPQLAALLRDPDPRVWWNVSKTMVWHGIPEKEFLQWLRSKDPTATLAYLLFPPWGDATLWRDGWVVGVWGEVDETGYGYWSGRLGEPLEPFGPGVRFLEKIVDDADLEQRRALLSPEGISSIKERAVRALSAMLAPDETDLPRSEASLRIRTLIERAVREDPDPEVRFQAIWSLLRRSTAWTSVDDFVASTLDEWEQLRCVLLHGRSLGEEEVVLLGYSSDDDSRLLEPIHLRALLHLDHPRTLAILEALRHRTEFREAIEIEQARAQPLGSLPLPNWEPAAAVRRHLLADPSSRARAALFAARHDLQSTVPNLTRALEVESLADLQTLERACLYALGDASHRGAVVEKLRARVRRARDEEEAPYPRIDDPRDYELSLSDLATPLLLAGDLEAIDLVARNYDLDGVPYLEDFVEGLPEDTRDLDRCRPRWTPIQFVTLDEWEACVTAVRSWWEAHGDAVTWNPQRRKFVAPP